MNSPFIRIWNKANKCFLSEENTMISIDGLIVMYGADNFIPDEFII